MEKIIIRSMNVADIPAVIAIGNEAPELSVSGTTDFWDEETLRNWVEADSDILLVAENDGRVVGFHLTQMHLPTRSGYFSDIAIHPEYRRRGIGTKLIEETLAAMKLRGITYVYGLTKVKNDKIHHLLESFGFEQGEAFYWFEKKRI